MAWLLILGAFLSPQFPAEYPAEIVSEARGLAFEARYPEALELFRSALAYAPQDALLHYYVGITHFKMKDYKSARRYLHRSIELGAAFPEPYLWLGRTFLELGDVEEATEVSNRGVEKFSRHEELLELQALLAQERP